MRRILVTGGAGFIGSHLVDRLLDDGHSVRVLDALSVQVHPDEQWPDYLNGDAERIRGDVRDAAVVRKALEGIDAVYHLAAVVGVGQSMYEMARYTGINSLGTAALLEALIAHPVEKLIVASSMSVYGEGRYRTPDGKLVDHISGSLNQLRSRQWELVDERGDELEPIPTPEEKQPGLASVYALTKYDQERLCLITGRAYGIPVMALRFFNVYGPRQALSNPYTGVMAIFASRCLRGRSPVVFEDGRQKRDFVSVHDVAHACKLALEVPGDVNTVVNIGSGRPITILEVARLIGTLVSERQNEPLVTGQYRSGDIRHCFADVGRAQQVLGFRPRIPLEQGLVELAEWLQHQPASPQMELATEQLNKSGLTI
ncbi:MAG TPA: NAD-dependent epimerase/dehydratase family protein [Acidobacteriota bacterium]|nr:NAD-dependent epimerase/dehydratase family protein [Acidobacteriota bacterium]